MARGWAKAGREGKKMQEPWKETEPWQGEQESWQQVAGPGQEEGQDFPEPSVWWPPLEVQLEMARAELAATRRSAQFWQTYAEEDVYTSQSQSASVSQSLGLSVSLRSIGPESSCFVEADRFIGELTDFRADGAAQQKADAAMAARKRAKLQLQKFKASRPLHG